MEKRRKGKPARVIYLGSDRGGAEDGVRTISFSYKKFLYYIYIFCGAKKKKKKKTQFFFSIIPSVAYRNFQIFWILSSYIVIIR